MNVGARLWGAGVAVAGIVGVSLVSFVINSYFHYHKSVDGIFEQFQDFDTLSLVNDLPHPLFAREISSDVTQSTKTYYIYGPKYAGKSTIGKLISIETAQKKIPFLYAYVNEQTPQEACISLGGQIGYYDTNAPYYYQMLDALNNNKQSEEPCIIGEIWNSIERAAEKLPVDVVNDVKPLVIIDGIEALSGKEIMVLCRKIRDTERKIKYIILSTPDLAADFFDYCKDGQNFKRYFVGPVTYDETMKYLTSSECKMQETEACEAYGLFGGYLNNLNSACNGENMYDILHEFVNQWKANFANKKFVDLNPEMKNLALTLAESDNNDINCEPYMDDLWPLLLQSKYSEIITIDNDLHCHFTNNMFGHFFAIRFKQQTENEIKQKLRSKCAAKEVNSEVKMNVAVGTGGSQSHNSQ